MPNHTSTFQIASKPLRSISKYANNYETYQNQTKILQNKDYNKSSSRIAYVQADHIKLSKISISINKKKIQNTKQYKKEQTYKHIKMYNQSELTCSLAARVTLKELYNTRCSLTNDSR